MRKVLVAMALVLSAASLPSQARAAAWNVPSNVRVVQKSHTDQNGRIYGSIQAAINSITNASATNPYLVQIMPGVYAESVTMKPYVSLAGSGPSATQIVFSGGTAITGASGAEIRDLAIVGTAGGNGIYNFDASPRIRNVTITISGATTPGYPMAGIYSYARSAGIADVRVDDVRISLTSTGGGALGVVSMGEWNGSGYNTVNTVVRNSVITVDTQNIDGVQTVGVNANGYATVTVEGSRIDVSGFVGSGVVAGAYAQYVTIANSQITVQSDNGYAGGVVLFGGWDVVSRIHHAVIQAPTAITSAYGGPYRCASVYDANLNPICP